MPETARQLDPTVATDLALLALELANNKETRKEFGKLVRKAKPESKHAHAFSDVEMDERLAEIERKNEEKEIKRQQDAIVARMQAQRDKLLNGEGGGRKYAEDDVKKIETLMQSKGITDYEDGATLYAATLPPENPMPSGADAQQHGATWEFPEWGKFGKDPVRASRDTAHQVITEFMRKR
jgi:hypothetical protein